MKYDEKPRANPNVLLREEFDDWAVLYDPDTGQGFGLNPMGVYLWKLLDGEHTVDGILKTLQQDALEVPEEACTHLIAFVEDLTRHGLAGCTIDTASSSKQGSMRGSVPTTGRAGPTVRAIDTEGPHVKTVYQRPRLEQFTNDPKSQATGTCNTGGGCCLDSGNPSTCNPGNGAATAGLYTACAGGTSATDTLTLGGPTSCNVGTGATARGSSGGCAQACNAGPSGTSCKYGYSAAYFLSPCQCGNGD